MIVIGDVHGCFESLKALLNQIEDIENHDVCMLGDLIDRGPKSKQVVDFVIENEFKCILGNHEFMFCKVVEDPWEYSYWLEYGGNETLASFDCKTIEEFKEKYYQYYEYFKALPLYLEYNNFILSHSTAFSAWTSRDGKTEKDRQSFEDHCLWNRHFEVKNLMPEGKINVIGHTPVATPIHRDHYIMIDTGCVYKKYLTAMDLDDGGLYIQEYID